MEVGVVLLRPKAVVNRDLVRGGAEQWLAVMEGVGGVVKEESEGQVLVYLQFAQEAFLNLCNTS